MKLVWASLTFILVFVSFVSDAHSSMTSGKDAPLVRVRLKSLSSKIQISGLGLRFQNLTQNFRPVAIPQDGQAEVRVLQKDGKKIWALRTGTKASEHLFTDKYLLIQGHNVRIGSQSLPSRVLLSMNAGMVDVVGVMPLDEYVVGVLASEMPLSWPLETLKAQAIAARSYALAVINERKDKPYHLESSVLDQVFRHVVAEDRTSPLIQKAMQAVEETKGIKLWDPKSRVLKAFYHSDCGGKTTTSKNVWNYGVNTGIVVDSSCPTNPRGQWKLTLTKDDLKKRLRVADFDSIEFDRNPQDQRVQAVRVAFNGSPEKVLSANDFRQSLGFQDLRSALFEMKKQGEEFLFQGRGFGHGVGLCQWGSRSLGQKGYTYKQILNHYYPLAKLQ
ncbi:SpoIID/LytB domain-containing protein [Bdellovibrio bacteriovorus]|uniref:SpoIID/LytB domain-containing protein n=1 Tax=Bdellovibrio bacteriovorus TaxID=959 RepID=UPI0021CF5A92|nr:SpoIID/LytB domain-containing protein [Bdellovibrio bacteriovorus]UXR63289.1 SpoIID/LytB domain-containing protein [Bdellovibrio bacteriovorus]